MSLVRCDIFCRVIDNFGDVGVTWRLARQLGREHQWQVRLFIDDLASLHQLAPEIEIGKLQQRCGLTDIFVWNAALDIEAVADVVIEAFACTLPDIYVERMALRPAAPVWLNLEYLTAESWIESHHLLGSREPRRGLDKTFFFPGFTERTGGLLRESDLLAEREAYDQAIAGLARTPKALLFGYPNPAASALIAAMRTSGVVVEVPVGALAEQLRAAGDRFKSRAFVPQIEFDALLAEFDVLFVRGEDSFVRAQWSAKPFVWQIYPQDEDVHFDKLDAFLDRYCVAMDAQAATAVRGLWMAWNRQDTTKIGAAWQTFWEQRAAIVLHARQWRAQLAAQPDLAAQIVTFCRKMIKI